MTQGDFDHLKRELLTRKKFYTRYHNHADSSVYCEAIDDALTTLVNNMVFCRYAENDVATIVNISNEK